MTVFYQCDFCPEDESKLIAHNPNSPSATIVANDKPGASVICEKCVLLAFEIVEDNKLKYKEATRM